MLTRAWVLVLALLGPTSAWAQGAPAPLPDYDTCTFVWSALVMYERTTPTGPPRKVGTVTLPPGLTFPCPTVKGTYYYSAAVVGPDGQEAPLISETLGFTIKGGAPVPIFAIGAAVKVNTPLLNVRSSPGGPVLGTQKGGTPAQIIGGPVSVPFGSPPVQTTFWQLDYAAGVDGWCSEGFLLVVPTP